MLAGGDGRGGHCPQRALVCGGGQSWTVEKERAVHERSGGLLQLLVLMLIDAVMGERQAETRDRDRTDLREGR